MSVQDCEALTMDKNDNTYDLTDIADLREGPGILVLSTDLRLIHMNRRGWELMQHINSEQAVKAAGVLPAQVIQMCAEIEKLLRGQSQAKDWEQLEVRRLV